MKSKRKKPLQNDTVSKLILAKVLLELVKAVIELINRLIE